MVPVHTGNTTALTDHPLPFVLFYSTERIQGTHLLTDYSLAADELRQKPKKRRPQKTIRDTRPRWPAQECDAELALHRCGVAFFRRTQHGPKLLELRAVTAVAYARGAAAARTRPAQRATT